MGRASELLNDEADVRRLRFRHRHGLAEAARFGAATARGRYLAFLGEDLLPAIGWLDSAIESLAESPLTSVVAGMVLTHEARIASAGGRTWSDGTLDLRHAVEDASDARLFSRAEVDHASLDCLVVLRRDYQSVGGLDERYATDVYAAADLCMSLRAKGLRTVYDPEVEVRACARAKSDSSTALADGVTGDPAVSARDHARFVFRWAGELERRLPPGTVTDAGTARVTHAQRVLVVGEEASPGAPQGTLHRAAEIAGGGVALGCDVTLLVAGGVAPDALTRTLRRSGIIVISRDDRDTTLEAVAHGSDFDAVVLTSPRQSALATEARRRNSRTVVIVDNAGFGAGVVTRDADDQEAPSSAAARTMLRCADLVMTPGDRTPQLANALAMRCGTITGTSPQRQ